MTSRFRFGALLVAIVAMFAFASSSAMAKGGGGGTCATLNDFTVTPGSGSITVGYSVFNGCVDEVMPAIGLNVTNVTTGTFIGRSVTMASFGLNQSTRVLAASPSTTYTISIDVYTPNGKLQAQSSRTVTTPAT